MIYLDASVAIAALIDEDSSESVLRWLAGMEFDSLAASAWVGTEVISGLSVKYRNGAVTLDILEEAQSFWRAIAAHSLNMIPITSAHFGLAERYCADPSLSLRAGDALHLAIAQVSNHEIATLDKGMLSAARTLEIAAFNPAKDVA